MKNLALPFFLIFSYSVCGFSWSNVGHRVVGQIAEDVLRETKPKTFAKIHDLAEGESLAVLATWADEIRSDNTVLPGIILDPTVKVKPEQLMWGWVPPLHYATISEMSSYVVPPEGDIIQALAQLQKIIVSSDPVDVASAWMPPLKNFTALQLRQIALRLIVHFVGDIHQPLHVGAGLDRGGNSCFVKWFGQTTNLHTIWDEKIIMNQNLSYTEYAAKLRTKKNLTGIEWETMDVLSWAQESIAERNRLYPKQIEPAADGRSYSYCAAQAGEKIPEKLIPDLGYDYEFQFRPVIERRLFQAGMRLANLLDSLFGQKSSNK